MIEATVWNCLFVFALGPQSAWDSFLCSTSTKQWGCSILLKETTPHHEWGLNKRPCYQESDALPTELWVLPSMTLWVLKLNMFIVQTVPGLRELVLAELWLWPTYLSCESMYRAELWPWPTYLSCESMYWLSCDLDLHTWAARVCTGWAVTLTYIPELREHVQGWTVTLTYIPDLQCMYRQSCDLDLHTWAARACTGWAVTLTNKPELRERVQAELWPWPTYLSCESMYRLSCDLDLHTWAVRACTGWAVTLTYIPELQEHVQAKLWPWPTFLSCESMYWLSCDLDLHTWAARACTGWAVFLTCCFSVTWFTNLQKWVPSWVKPASEVSVWVRHKPCCLATEDG